MVKKVYHLGLKYVTLISNIAKECQAKIVFMSLGNAKRKIVRENVLFKEKYKGKRCFVVGNGPSLNKQDLSLLKNEYVFTVNELMRDERFEMMSPQFHIFADPLYYKSGHENKIYKLLLKLENKKNPPIVFFPIQGKEVIDKFNFSNINFHYFFSGCNMYEGYNKKFDYTKSIPGFYTVVHYAIVLAMYMGFSEINILGCDMTGYRWVEKKILGRSEEEHCYQMSEEESKKIHEENETTCEQFFYGYSQMFRDYRRLFEYSKKNRIKLVNVTEGGILDSLPRKKYENIVSEKG